MLEVVMAFNKVCRVIHYAWSWLLEIWNMDHSNSVQRHVSLSTTVAIRRTINNRLWGHLGCARELVQASPLEKGKVRTSRSAKTEGNTDERFTARLRNLSFLDLGFNNHK